MSDPDRTLAGRAGRGDRQALLALYERYKGRLLGFLRRSVVDPALAEDVFQEVWVKVMERIATYRPAKAPFRAWLFRVAANAAVDRLRRERVRSGPSLDAPLGEGQERWIDRLPSLDPDPERAMQARGLATEVDQALAALNPRQRTAVLLRHQQGWTYSEIADALGVREGTAKTLVHRGLLRMRERLEPERTRET